MVNPPAPHDPAVNGRCEPDTLVDLFARFQAELLGTLVCLVGNLEDARDALQDAFMKCWRHQDKLAQIENPKAWIFQIALNTGRDLRDAAWRRKRVPLDGDMSMLLANDNDRASAGPGLWLEQEDELAQVRHAVAALRPEEQEIFLLRQNAQQSYEEIAESLALPLGTVKTRMRRALAKLRIALAPPPQENPLERVDGSQDSPVSE